MESLGLASILGIVAIIWYLGSSINAVLAGSGEVAEREFENFKAQQDIRLYKERIKATKSVEKMMQEPVMTFKELSKTLNTGKEED